MDSYTLTKLPFIYVTPLLGPLQLTDCIRKDVPLVHNIQSLTSL
jgi:hypothetical protein